MNLQYYFYLKKNFEKNIFSFLLNTYLFCFKDKNIENEEYKITNEIIKYFEIENKKNNIYNKSPYLINSDINFISINIFSYNFLYQIINSKNIESFESLTNYFNTINTKVILVFTKIFYQ